LKIEWAAGVSIGAEVTGADLAGELSPRDVDAILETLFVRHVVVFREQSLTLDQQIRFAGRLGTVAPPEPSKGLTTHEDTYPEVQWLTYRPKRAGEDADPRPSQADTWHTDYSYLPAPPELVCLYGAEIPADGPDTLYVDMAAAHDALSEERQSRYESLRAIHSQRGALDPRVFRLPPYVVDGVLPDASLTPDRAASHPLVRVHPVSGRKSLYLADCYAVGIEGMAERDGREEIAGIYRHALAPERMFRHVWRAGDCVVSDNTTTNHRRSRPLSGSPRTLSRVMIFLGGASGPPRDGARPPLATSPGTL
jgi:taurine dioxygenase